jgi:dynein heavy chain
VQEHINQLPLYDLPDVFGMHENADLVYANIETQVAVVNSKQNLFQRIFDTIICTEPRQQPTHSFKIDEGATAEKLRGNVRFTNEFLHPTGILGQIPPPWDVEMVLKRHPISYTDSLASILYHEVIAYNKLITVVTESIQQVLQALKGYKDCFLHQQSF